MLRWMFVFREQNIPRILFLKKKKSICLTHATKDLYTMEQPVLY